MEPAEVTVQLIPDDIRKFSKHCSSFNWAGLLQFVGAIALFAGIQFLQRPDQRWVNQTIVLSILACVVLFVALVFFGLWSATRPGRLKRAMPDAFFPKLYLLSADGIHEETKTNQITWRWEGIEKMDDTNDYFFFMIAPRRGFVIPKRCFHPPDAAAVFANQARAFLKANREKAEQQA